MKSFLTLVKNNLGKSVTFIKTGIKNLLNDNVSKINHFFNNYSPRTTSLLLNTAKSIYIRKWLLFTLIQKALVTYSVYSLSQFEKNSELNQNNFAGLSINHPACLPRNSFDLPFKEIFHVIVPLITSMIPELYANFHLKHAQADALNKYVQEFTNVHSGKALLFKSKHHKTEREPYIIGGEGNKFVSSSIEYFCGLTEASITLLFDLGVLAIKPNTRKWIFLAQPIVFFSTLFLYSKFKKKINLAYKESAVTRQKLSGSLVNAWDNITISNDYNLTKWMEFFRVNWEMNKQIAPHADFLLKKCAFILVQLNSIPTIILSFVSGKIKFSTLVNLGKTQKNMTQFFDLALRWQVFLAYLETMDNSLREVPLTDRDYLSHIKFNEIQIQAENKKTEMDCKNANEFFERILNLQFSKKPTRITLRGENGKGKSVLLAYAKDKLKNKAMLIPPNSQLIFSTKENSASSGEAILQQYNTIKNEHLYKNQIILADEWDANLDDKNKAVVNEILNEIAKESVVVEVRHRV